jgi:hypothetical protein
MTQEHPLMPPIELLKQWEDQWFGEEEHTDVLLIRAYQAGADAELEACCKLLDRTFMPSPSDLRAARRPKPLTLKEQALLAIDTAVADDRLSADIALVVRRALEESDD